MKELGAAVYNCSCLAEDLGKIFEAYWALGVPGAAVPVPWPANYSTAFNAETPLELKLNGTAAAVYFSVRPRRDLPFLGRSAMAKFANYLVRLTDASGALGRLFRPKYGFIMPKFRGFAVKRATGLVSRVRGDLWLRVGRVWRE